MSKKKISTLTDWNEFFDELQNESPRAAVIIASAFLEAQLSAILSNTLIDNPKVVKDLFENDLRDFSTKIKIVYCMGLISESIFHDLNVIRKIRNKFAHEMHGYNFDEPEIVDLCKTLKLANMITDVVIHIPNSHGNLFILGVAQLAMLLGIKIVETQTSHVLTPKNPEVGQIVSM